MPFGTDTRKAPDQPCNGCWDFIRTALIATIVAAQTPAHRGFIRSPAGGSPMSWAGRADWLERSERELEEEPDKALATLGSAGSHCRRRRRRVRYFTVRLAARVGPAGRCMRNDLQPEMLNLLRARIARERIANVVLRAGHDRGSAAALALARSRADGGRVSRVLGAAEDAPRHPVGAQTNQQPCCSNTGRRDPSVPIRLEHKMSVEEAKMELEAEGFRLSQVDGRLPANTF